MIFHRSRFCDRDTFSFVHVLSASPFPGGSFLDWFVAEWKGGGSESYSWSSGLRARPPAKEGAISSWCIELTSFFPEMGFSTLQTRVVDVMVRSVAAQCHIQELKGWLWAPNPGSYEITQLGRVQVRKVDHGDDPGWAEKPKDSRQVRLEALGYKQWNLGGVSFNGSACSHLPYRQTIDSSHHTP